jgi:hypothetical protein
LVISHKDDASVDGATSMMAADFSLQVKAFILCRVGTSERDPHLENFTHNFTLMTDRKNIIEKSYIGEGFN